MFKLSTRVATIAISAAVAVTSFTPSFAMQMPAAPVSSTTPSDVQQVQWHHGYYGGGAYYHHGYYNGYRGYSGYHYGYHHYDDGNWYPLAAFGAGALIGGAIVSQPHYYAGPSNGINPQHYAWCEARYRSYRGFDNTFQPNYGPRQQCLSPYY